MDHSPVGHSPIGHFPMGYPERFPFPVAFFLTYPPVPMPPVTTDSPSLSSVPRAQSVVGRIAKETGVSTQEARRRLEETLKFLAVAARSERPVSPSEVIDEAWHCFLVHTRAYQEYCAEQLGQFVHHRPTGNEPAGEENESGNRDAYQRARSMAERQFGSLDTSIWPRLGEGAGCKEGACTGECSAECHGDCGT